MTKQADVDKIMLDLDGTENKCKYNYPINNNNLLTTLYVLSTTLETEEENQVLEVSMSN